MQATRPQFRVIANRPALKREPPEAIAEINFWGLLFLGLLALGAVAALTIVVFALQVAS